MRLSTLTVQAIDAVGADGTFVVADAPFGRQRVQLFAEDGRQLGGWSLPGDVAENDTPEALLQIAAGRLGIFGNHDAAAVGGFEQCFQASHVRPQ